MLWYSRGQFCFQLVNNPVYIICLEGSIDEVVISIDKLTTKLCVIKYVIENLGMLIWVRRITGQIDIILINVPAIEAEAEVCVIQHISPLRVQRILTPKFNII